MCCLLRNKKNYPTTSLDESYLALKIKLVKGRGFDSYKTTEKKKEHKRDTVFTETGGDDVEFLEENEGVPHITHVNNILHSIFSNAELYNKNHQIYRSNGPYAHKTQISNTFKSTLTDYKKDLHCQESPRRSFFH